MDESEINTWLLSLIELSKGPRRKYKDGVIDDNTICVCIERKCMRED